jgi:hypothetical protein
MKSSARKSREIVAVRKTRAARRDPHETQFVALLRRKCVRAASVGAVTAAAESLPGFGRALSLVFGELLDVEMLARVQRELIEETFALYEFNFPPALRDPLVRNVQLVGAGASVAGDALARGMLQRALSRIGTQIARRAVPVAAVVSSAFANATITYAIGKRAQAVARLRDAPLTGMPDALRAFTGVDERRVFAWSLAAAKGTLTEITDAVVRLARKATGAKKKTARRKRA